MNSPTMCQYYVAKALEPVRKQFPDFLVIHYMDDILFSAPSVLETQQMFDVVQQCLKASGLVFFFLAYFTLYNWLQFHPSHQKEKHQYSILTHIYGI